MYLGLRMWCDYLRCLYSFLKIEVNLCFKFDLIREVLDIRDFLKETTSALRLRFDCITLYVDQKYQNSHQIHGKFYEKTLFKMHAIRYKIQIST